MASKDFGRRLDSARRRAGMTQGRLAEALGTASGEEVSQQKVSNWCRGENLPGDRATLVTLCRVLAAHGGFASRTEAETLLHAADQGALHPNEVIGFPPDWAMSTNGAGAEASNGHGNALPPGANGAGRGQNDATGDGDGAVGNGPTHASGSTDDGEPWYSRVVARVGVVQTALERPEIGGAAGAMIGSAVVVGAAWLLLGAAAGGAVLPAVALGAALWGSTALITLLPAEVEPPFRSERWWRLKRYRLSGAAAGVMVQVGLLLCGEGLYRLLFGGSASPALLFPLAALGALFAYAGGAEVQRAFARGSAGDDFYMHASRNVALMMLAAQMGFVLFLVLVAPTIPPDWFSLLLFAALSLVLCVEVWRRQGIGGAGE